MSNPALRINVGMHVEIKRSDGRIHGAVVSEIRGSSYMVEWYEKGETKGKEVSLDELVLINPTLFRQQPAPQPAKSRVSVAPHTSIMALPTNLDNDSDDDFLLTTHSAPPPKASKPTPSIHKDESRKTTTSGPLKQLNSTIASQPRTFQRPPSPPEPKMADAINGNANRRLTQSQRKTEVVPKSEKKTPSLAAPTIPQVASTPAVRQMDPPPPPREKQELRKPASLPAIVELETTHPNYAFAQMIREYRAQVDYRPLLHSDAVAENRISVCVRKRPLSKKEVARGEIEVVTIPNKDHVVLHQPQVKVDLTKYLENQKFRFDYTFDENSTNELVYRFTAQPLVKTIFEQGTATCFAYGQTGSGKTHTMGGDFTGKKQNSALGVYALTARDVFKCLNKEYRKQQLSVHCSFFEIYGAKVYDLLANKAMLRVLEDGKAQVQVVGLREVDVDSEDRVLELINQGTAVRTAGTTSANSNSSRSHAVFQIILRQAKKQWGKFSLIDLAGNERGQDTRDCDRETRLEGAEINKSLLALKECIRAMSMNNSHVPFRSSKLTLVLRDSFMGDKARTVMISMVSPGMSSCEHSLNTLRYANRVKELGTEEGDERCSPMDDMDFMVPLDSEIVDYGCDEDDDVIDLQQVEKETHDIITELVEDSTKLAKDGRRLKAILADGSKESVAQAIDGTIGQLNTQMAAMQRTLSKLTDLRSTLSGN